MVITQYNERPLTSTSTNFAGIAVSGSTASPNTTGGASASNVTIEGNTVNGGYYGITLVGNGTALLNTGNVVRNNIRDFYLCGLYVYHQDGAQFVGSDVARPLRTNGSICYGIYLQSSRALAVEKNRIHDAFVGNPTSTSTLYGIYVGTGAIGTATATNDFVNNVLYNLSGSGAQYGIYNLGGTFSRIYNNTVNSD